MNTLQEFFRHGQWANTRVFKVCERADAAVLTVDAGGTNGTVLATLAHMVSVSEAFAAIVARAAGSSSTPTRPSYEFLVTPTGLADGYFDHELQWFAERAAYLDSYFHDVASQMNRAALDQLVHIPWMGFEITIEQALMQVLVHCGHHRSQVFSALGEQGVRVPDLDYIIMLAKERKTT